MMFFTPCLTCSANSNELVRVGISDTSFKKLAYSDISVFSTDEYGIYEKSTSKLLINLTKENVVTFSYDSGKFSIYVDNALAVKNYEGIIIVHSTNGLLGVKNLTRKSKQALYHGIFEITPKNEKEFFIVNVLDLQEYLKGVVPNEMPVRFGLEALKAQAVAARNYVLMPRTRAYKEFDVDDSVASQVYFGANTETELSTQAVDETLGIVALYNWELILAQYCSTAGGYTEDFSNAFSDNKLKMFPAQEKPYLKGRPDILDTPSLETEEAARKYYTTTPNSYDMNSPYYRWQKEFERAELEQTLKKTLPAQSKTGFVYPMFQPSNDIGELKELKVLKRGVSGKIMELEIITTSGTWKASKELVIRRLLQKDGISLPSANVVFDHEYDENNRLQKIVAYGGGFGHGVGMSQFGAGFMAQSLDRNYTQILKRYYTDIAIATTVKTIEANPVSLSFYTPVRKGVLVIDNAHGIKNLTANINGEIVELELHRKFLDNELRINISRYLKKGQNDITFSIPNAEKGKGLKVYVELVEKDG